MTTATKQVGLLARLRGYLSLVRLRPFDTSTEGGRANERHRRIVLSAAASFASKAVHSVTLLLTVRLTLEYMGLERFGVWTSMTTLLSMLAFGDLGLGNGMISVLADTQGRDDRAAARRVVSSATMILLLVAVLMAVLFAAAYPWIDWGRVFNVEGRPVASEAGRAFAVCLALFLISIPLNAIQSIHLGYQEGFAVNIVQGITSVLTLAALVVAMQLKLGLTGLTALWFGAAVLVRIGNGVYMFGRQRPWLFPRWRDVDWPTGRRLLKSSFLYLVIGMSIAIGYTSHTFVIAHILGQETVAEYSVPYRLFSIVTVVLGFFLIPLWPAYAEAAARGDVAWVRRTLVRSLQLGLAFNVTAGLVLVVFGQQIIHLWVGSQVTPSTTLMVAFGLYLLVNCLHGPISMLLNGLSVVRFQLACWVSMACLNLVLSIVLTKKFGVSGVVFATVIANMLCFVLPGAWYARRRMAQMGALAPQDRPHQNDPQIPVDPASASASEEAPAPPPVV